MKRITAIFLFLLLLCGCAQPAVPQEEPPLPVETVVLPQIPVEDTAENRKAAIIETAKAYWYKNPYVQYDNVSLSVVGDGDNVRTSHDDFNTPEMASEDRSIYHVCVSFTYHCIYHTFGYKLLGGLDNAYVNQVALADGLEEITVYRRKNDKKDPAANRKAMEEVRALLQPGDVLTFFRYTGSGHSILWCGDLNGDGLGDLLNSDGEYYDKKTGTDKREAKGGIDLNTDRFRCPSGEWFLFNPKSSQCLTKMDYYSVLRFSDKADLAPLTERAKTRVLFPGLEITYTCEEGIFGAVDKNGELTYTLTLKNHSGQDHEGIEVQIPAPKNARITKIDGTKTETALLRRTLSVPAGKQQVLTYTVKPAAEVGSRIVTAGGYVHAIPLPEITTVIQSAAPDADAVKNAIQTHADKKGMDFVSAVCRDLGVKTDLSDANAIRAALFTEQPRGDSVLYTPRETVDEAAAVLQRMQIPAFYGGYYTATGKDGQRVKELRVKDLQAGDILLWQTGTKADFSAAVHDGKSLRYPKNGELVRMTQKELDRFLQYRFFIALRPSQAE